MKIALCVPSWPPGIAPNGIVTYASELVPALKQRGHEIFLLTYDKTGQDAATTDLGGYSRWGAVDRIMFRIVPEIVSFNAASRTIASAIHDLFDKERIDIVEMDEAFGFALKSSQLNLLPVVVRLHGPWFLNGRFDDPNTVDDLHCRREEREGRAIQHAHFVTAPSAEVLRSVKDRYELTLPASRIIHNPISAATESNVWKLSALHAVDSILFVGRFDKRKGGDLILRAFAELINDYPNVKLTFVGPDYGFKETQNKILPFEEFVRTKLPEISKSSIEFCGQLSHTDVMALRTKRFLTVIASQYEIMPYSVLEAMSVGSPLVATSVGGIPELIKDQRNGLLVPPQDKNAIVAACKKLIDHPVLAAQLGRQAWLDCRECYNPDVIADQTLNTYSEAIDSFKKRRLAS